RRLRAEETSAIAAERCGALSSPMLRPALLTIVVGRLDQRARCFSSSKENSTLARCFWSSVARKAFAALTILAVAVCAMAALNGTRTKIDIRTAAAVLMVMLLPADAG